MAIADITKPMALDETLQATNTALGTLNTTNGGIVKDATLQASNTALGLIKTAIEGVGMASVGNLSQLTTTDKTSLVAAVNELVGDISDLDTDKADKVTGVTNGNLAGLDGNGNLTDVGWSGDKTTTNATGNPISITGLKSDQLAVNPIITFEPIQAGSGTPSPSNIRAISGYDKVEVLSCGKNLFDGTFSVTGKYLNSSGGTTDSGMWNISQYIPVKSSTAYYFSNINTGVSSACICWYNKAKEFISATNIGGVGFTDTSPVNACYVRASVLYSATNVCINEGNSAITYEFYHKTTDISESLGQTVYGGSLDVRTGKFTVEFVKKVYDGSSDEAWTKDGFSFYIADNTLIKELSYTTNMIKCNRLETVDRHSLIALGDVTNAISGYKDTNAQYSGQNWIYIGVSNISDVASLKTWLSNNPIEVVFELVKSAQAVIQLTPHEISLLSQYAYVSTNGTTITLDYHNGEMASLSDVSQLGETVNNNSFRQMSLLYYFGNVTADNSYDYDITNDYPLITADTLKMISLSMPYGSSGIDSGGVVHWRIASGRVVATYVCKRTQNNARCNIRIFY